MSILVVVVTGGSGGIGQALIKKYLQEGCFVISADLEKTLSKVGKQVLNLRQSVIKN